MQKLIMMLAITFAITDISNVSAQSKTETINRESTTHTQNNKIDSQTSISRSKEAYKFEADFVASKNKAVKKMIMSSLGDHYLVETGDRYEWKRNSNGKELFHGYLESEKLQLKLNKEIAPTEFYTQITALGDDLRALITTHDQSHDPQLNNGREQKIKSKTEYEVELRNAERALEAAQQKLELVKNKSGY